ncbi:pentapeptide repeat-containing protein [Arcanobacterium haemolyticum]
MNQKTNAQKIQEWRKNNADTRLTEDLLKQILELETLADADLTFADLSFADLCYANLSFADLTFADLCYANLDSANLCGANLSLVYYILQISNFYKYQAIFKPTPDGWKITIGCWTGSIEELRTLADKDDGWPESTGKKIIENRPRLHLIADMCEMHMARFPGYIEKLAEKWGGNES